MDRKPLDPPFPVGARLRYVGPHRSYAIGADGSRVPIEEIGLEVVVEAVQCGRRGTGRQMRDEDGPMEYDDGEPILDTTRDGSSVWFYTVDGQRHGRLILCESSREWEPIRPA